MAQYSVLQRIELLLNINPTLAEEHKTDNERLETVYAKLTEYITTTKSMLHECMLTLAETVVDQLQMTSEKDNDEFMSDNTDSESESYYSNPEEEEEDLIR